MGAPALLDAQATRALENLNAIAAFMTNHFIGGPVTDGGTTQASGANTSPNVDLDVAAATDVLVGGTPLDLAAAIDVDADAGDQIVWGATSGVSARGLLVRTASEYVCVFGDVAPTGDEMGPSQAQLDAALGAGEAYAPVAWITLERTGDTAVTLTIDHTGRWPQAFLVKGPLEVSETAFANAGLARSFPVYQDPPPSVP